MTACVNVASSASGTWLLPSNHSGSTSLSILPNRASASWCYSKDAAAGSDGPASDNLTAIVCPAPYQGHSVQLLISPRGQHDVLAAMALQQSQGAWLISLRVYKRTSHMGKPAASTACRGCDTGAPCPPRRTALPYSRLRRAYGKSVRQKGQGLQSRPGACTVGVKIALTEVFAGGRPVLWQHLHAGC